jgi:serine protease Do
MNRFISLLVAALLGGLVSVFVFQHFFAENTVTNNKPGVQLEGLHHTPASLARYMTKLPTTLPDFTLVAEMTVNAVVHIRTEYERPSSVYEDFFGPGDPFRDFFFGPRQRQPQQRRPVVASGSGVIVSADGYILTNNHVVTEADLIEVTLNDNRIYTATIVGTDPTTDLALIKIEEEGLPFALFGDSDAVRVGEWVLAVGNPFNLTSTVTAGIVSAKGRNINILGGGTAIESFIQTDAAVNRGNSGGALVNTQGELIGINAAIASTTGSFAGYSFAIPSNIARKVMDDLMEHGEVQRGLLGVSITELNSRMANELGLSIHRGAYVAEVNKNSAGEEAGLKEGDVIIGIDNQQIRNPSELLETLGRRRPGDKVKILYSRDGKEKETEAVLRNVYGEVALVRRGDVKVQEFLGAGFEPVTRDELQRLNIRNGVRVSTVKRDEAMGRAGIRDGFVITHIDRQPVSSPQELIATLKNKSGGILVEGVYPDGRRAYYGLGLK